jgi:hypothetical protein
MAEKWVVLLADMTAWNLAVLSADPLVDQMGDSWVAWKAGSKDEWMAVQMDAH